METIIFKIWYVPGFWCGWLGVIEDELGKEIYRSEYFSDEFVLLNRMEQFCVKNGINYKE